MVEVGIISMYYNVVCVIYMYMIHCVAVLWNRVTTTSIGCGYNSQMG